MKNINIFDKNAPLINYTSDETEQLYRDDERVNQSLLKQMDKKGPNVLWSEQESISSSAFSVGTICDIECTRPAGTLDKYYTTLDKSTFPSPALQEICKYIVERLDTDFKITQQLVDDACVNAGEKPYGKSYKPETRLANVKACSEYMKQLVFSKDKTIVDNEIMQKGLDAAISLKTSNITSFLFNNTNKNKRYYYQLPIFGNVLGVESKGLLDICIVDFEAKSVHIYDVKTLEGDTAKFQYGAKRYGYYIQAVHYCAIINDMLKEAGLTDWQILFSFAVESSTYAGVPLIYNTAKSFLDVGYNGLKEVTANGILVAPAVKGLRQLIYDYKYYMKNEGDNRRRVVQENNQILNLEWNYTAY